MKYTYLLLNLLTIAFPLIRSFEHRIKFFYKWKYILISSLLTSMIFIPWDIWFTAEGVWSFNPQYLTGIYLVNLPIEEWLFFFCIPFACIFIYEVLNYFVKKDIFKSVSKPLSYILVLVLLIVAITNTDKLYTTINFSATALLLMIHLFIIKSNYLGRFYFTYFVSMIPFLIVNGVLTSLPVVSYDDTQNLSIRIYTIPIEDMIYSLFLILLNITFYEYFQNRSKTHEK
jgi:lycopene cyclase domain-containing protein